MRIVIDTDHPENSASSATPAAGFEALDGGPAPVAELRRTGRVPERAAEDETPAAAADEGGQAPPNPLRRGAEVAAAGDEQRA